MASAIEKCKLGDFEVPRIFNGLWQVSSNAWGTAPAAKIREAMGQYVENGLFAFGLVQSSFFSKAFDDEQQSAADHYGPAEALYGTFRSSLSDPHALFGATKWCVFQPVKATRDMVEAAVKERNTRMQTSRIDMLQVHWHDYAQKEYLSAFRILRDLQKEGRISTLGLCNFDSIRSEEICSDLGKGVIVSNQVQFSVVDTRPRYAMAEVCRKYDMKLLAYGTLCGGFLADKYLGAPEPEPYEPSMTPSKRKYLDMIVDVWGSWPLFQTLLNTLRQIGDKHGGVSISNVATRWVLDHEYVGAVLIGTRMGVSEHIEDNHRVFSFKLTEDDRAKIEEVITRSREAILMGFAGDCGSEYRRR